MQQAIINAGLFGVLLPALIAAGVLVAAWRPWQESSGNRVRWAPPLALGLAYAAAHIGLGGKPETMPYIAAGITLVGLAEAAFPDQRPLHWIVRAAAIPVLLWLVAGFMFENSWSTTQAILWSGGLAVAVAAMIGSFDTILERHQGILGPVVLTIFGTGASLVLALNNTARIGQLIGGLTAAAAASAAVSWWRDEAYVSRGGVAVFVLILTTMYASGYFQLFEQPVWASVALLAAPHILWLGEVGPLGEVKGWKGTALRVGLFTIAVGVAIGLGYASGMGGGSDYGAY
jgi:hypothetical protein